MDLSVLIPARNEMFLAKTIENLLENIEGDTEIIAICDGNWPDPPIKDHPRVNLIYHSQSIGQRASTNEAARLSEAKFIMKADAHCAFDKGFDVKLMADCEYDWTVVPRGYNLHGFNWKCMSCGEETYQGPKPTECGKCKEHTFEMRIVWKPRWNRRFDFARFDTDLHFQYWYDYKKRPEANNDIADLMCHVGACWFMHRQRFFDLGGLDEGHGSWGQMGVEISCKTWLSGGRQVVNKKTWYSHMFRTQPGFNFPYPMHGVEQARKFSRDLWENGKWEKAIHPLSWLIDKFAPVPTWDTPVIPAQVKGEEIVPLPKTESPTTNICISVQDAEHFKKVLTVNKEEPKEVIKASPKIGLVYYTDNQCEERVTNVVRQNLNHLKNGWDLVAVSLYPINFGRNFVVPFDRSPLTMFKQILLGLEEVNAEIVFLVEHDILYHPSHFNFVPPKKDVFYYNINTWKVDAKTGHALYYITKQTSGLCAYKDLLLGHYRKRVERVEKEGFTRAMGFEPGCHQFPRGVDEYHAESWESEYPNIDIRHSNNLTANRWKKEQFRSENSIRGWKEADEVPGWGRTKDQFDKVLRDAISKT
jgi:hypothetical protein